MTLVTDLIAAMQSLAAAVAATAPDPADRVRLLASLITAAQPGAEPHTAALGRRAALAELARAASECQPRSFDDAAALRDLVCGLLEAEEIVASDAYDDDVAAALRALRAAVSRDLARRGADLSPMRQVQRDASLPALVLAHALYGDATREPELLRMAGDPPHPCFMRGRFLALAR